MTLNELLAAIGSSEIQICRPDSWNNYDEVGSNSPFLIPLGNAKVEELGAVGKDVIRVSIDWNDVPYFYKEENK